VLLTDVALPHEMNGRQLAEAALRLRPNFQVWFITAYAQPAIVHHGRLDPASIGKPFASTGARYQNRNAAQFFLRIS
jgi:hypothetical protein